MPCMSRSDHDACARRVLSRGDVRVGFIWYVVVGGLSFLTDLAVFVAFLWAGVPVLGALVVGFLIGTLANYVLSRALAFTGGRYRRAGEILRLFIVALIGLLLTAALVALLMAIGISAVAAKILATPIALVWNYAGRRLFVFHPHLPHGTWRLSDRALARAECPPAKRYDQ